MTVYLSNLATQLADVCSADELLQAFYPPTRFGGSMSRRVRAYGRKVGIRSRSTVLDLESLPERRLSKAEYHPATWAQPLIESIVPSELHERIGHLIVVYNAAAHQNVLPSVSSQVLRHCPMLRGAFPLDMPHLGCAGALLAVERASELVRQSGRAAIVYVFEHCLWWMDPCSDPDDPKFRQALRTNALFSDASCAVLLVPEGEQHHSNGFAAQLVEQHSDHVVGDAVSMDGPRFVMSGEVAQTMPALVTKRVIEPVLQRRGLTADDVPQWSIHQGGLPVLEQFANPDHLGLQPWQIAASRDQFQSYGNLSAASCLFVLKHFWDQVAREGIPDHNPHGLVVGFGAGYYLSALLYRWVRTL